MQGEAARACKQEGHTPASGPEGLVRNGPPAISNYQSRQKYNHFQAVDNTQGKTATPERWEDPRGVC